MLAHLNSLTGGKSTERFHKIILDSRKVVVYSTPHWRFTLILGFTGTREGMTDKQREGVAEFLRVHRPAVVHHGDCVGADSQFHDSAMITMPAPEIEIHPSTLAKFRAYRRAPVIYPTKPPKDRNKDIIKASDELLAAPKATASESPRSGTWQTIRLALSFKKTVTVVWPDGTVQAWGYTSLAEIFEGLQ